MINKEIIELLPYEKPFLFVDEIEQIDANGVTGNYTFKKDDFFYKGHFKNNPVTPGVILTEVMAQIGVVCLGIYSLESENLLKPNSKDKIQIALTSSQVDFFLPVYPTDKVTVISEKKYLRFNKLKCTIKLFNSKQELVCRGEISGMFQTSK